MKLFLRIYAGLLLIMGFALAGGGFYLVTLHGSPYYLLSGIALSVSAVLLWQLRGEGAALYGLMVLATLDWAVWEVGYDGWALMPRLFLFAVLGLVLLIPAVRRTLAWRYVLSGRVVISVIVVSVAFGIILRAVVPPPVQPDPIYQAGIESPTDWHQ